MLRSFGWNCLNDFIAISRALVIIRQQLWRTAETAHRWTDCSLIKKQELWPAPKVPSVLTKPSSENSEKATSGKKHPHGMQILLYIVKEEGSFSWFFQRGWYQGQNTPLIMIISSPVIQTVCSSRIPALIFTGDNHPPSTSFYLIRRWRQSCIPSVIPLYSWSSGSWWCSFFLFTNFFMIQKWS